MDLTDPTRAVTSTLDGPVLAVLARAGRPVTVGEIATEVPRGSEIGIRRAVARLVEQGIVIATQMGRNTVHELNREHLAAPAADILSNLWSTLWGRLRDELAGWEVAPVYGCVFGSAARRDGNAASDIDLLLVHPPRPGETTPSDGHLIDQLNGVLVALSVKPTVSDTSGLWEEQVDQLRSRVHRWTGNRLQVVDLSVPYWIRLAGTDPHLAHEIDTDSIAVAGQPLLHSPTRPAR